MRKQPFPGPNHFQPARNFTLDDINLSFSGCGFNGIYHVGVASCFMEYCPQVCLNKVSGASAGAIAATALACQLPLGESTSEVLKVATQARSRALGPLHPTFDVNKIIRDALEKVLPEDAHKRVNGRLNISVTRVHDGKNVILSQFDSKEDLIQAVVCSCFIPFWSGVFPPKFHGVAYIDGGFTDNLLVLDENTVTISPFTGESDICPQDPYDPVIQVSVVNQSFALTPSNIYRLTRALFPPHPEVMAKLCKMGFDDALRFLQRNKVISCMRCVAIQSSFTVAETEDVMEEHESRPMHDYDGCRDCQSRREAAVLASLPDPVARAIQDICDQVDKGIINWFFKHRPVKVLSLVMLPYILPFDIAIVILIKLWRQVPLFKSHLKGTFKNLSNCIMQSSEHMYSAMFSCTLSVLEYSYHADDVTSQMVNHPAVTTCVPDGKKVQRSNTFGATPRQRKLGTIRQPMHRKSYAGNERFIERVNRKISCVETMKPAERVISTVNLGFNMTLGNSQSPRASNRSLNSSFKNLLDVTSPIELTSDHPPDPIETLKSLTEADGASSDKSEISALSLANRAFSLKEQEDAFDNSIIHSTILAAARNRNALMKYYYMDEQNRVKMTEIFNIPNADLSCQEQLNISQ